jgi:O-antigen/teichoic acid export membrane protein
MSTLELAAEPVGAGASTGLRRDIAMLAAGNAGVLLAQLGFRAILIGSLTPADYGRLSLVLAVYNTIWIIGASGVPSSVARQIALIAPADDTAIVRSAVRAAAVPAALAAVAIGVGAWLILGTPLAGFMAAGGLVSLIYALLAMGVLRGRGRVGLSAVVMPITGLAEVFPLAMIVAAGVPITLVDAFAVFCAGNVVGVVVGFSLLARTTVRARGADSPAPAPPARELLGFAVLLGAATLGVATLPMAMRSAAALDSYSTAAIVDIAILLLALPQRLGTVVLFAIVPHAARSLKRGERPVQVSSRAHLIVVPFALGSVLLLATPLARWLFDAAGRPAYAGAGPYLALALLAGPARVLYGVVEGVLIARGEGRFLAVTALSTTVAAAAAMFAAAALGEPLVAFAFYVGACWAIYLRARTRAAQLAAS